MNDFVNRLFGWFSSQPTAGVLMIVTALVLFATAIRRSTEPSNALWPWLRRIIEASVGAILFLALLGTFRSILDANKTTFNATHGSLSDTNLASAQSIWGRPHVQRELTVNHFIWKIEHQEQPRAKPDDPITYKDVPVRYPVPQNSITGFNGSFDMQLSEREKGYALYNGFIVDTALTYNIVNDSDQRTDVDYSLPLSPGQTLFEGFKILFDGNDISSALRYGGDIVTWQGQMDPHQKSQIDITYRSRGMSYLYYQIPIQRQINNFTLTVTVDKLPTTLLNYPEGVLSPTEVKPTADGQGSILTWKMDHAITTAGMGIALLQPEQPGAKVFRVLGDSPLAVMLLIAMVSVTLLLLGQSISFLDLALLGATYCVQFLVMAGTSDFALGFWGSLILGAALNLVLTVLLVRHYPRLVRFLLIGLVAFFAIVYPLGGLITEYSQSNAFDTLTQVGLALYIVAIALYQRLQAPKSTPTIEAPAA